MILYCLCAVALVLTGALVSGGLRLPARRVKHEDAQAAADDAFERDLAALLAYGREEDDHAV